MTTLNAYATLAEFKAYASDRGGDDPTADTPDDVVIENLLKAASKFLDTKTGRRFTPYVETRYYCVPDGRTLYLDDDLLEVISITNGDATTLSSSDYNLQPRNSSPRYAIRLKEATSVTWESDSDSNSEDVIAVAGIWGFHDRYTAAWLLSTTAAEAMDATETGYDVTSGSGFAIGNIIRFDNELGYVSNVATNTLTITRGENTSTAATHLTAISVYIWQVMEDARNAVLEYTQAAYKRRYGQAVSTTETITAAGIVLAPREIPAAVQEFIVKYRRLE